jgi:hypothetical protein
MLHIGREAVVGEGSGGGGTAAVTEHGGCAGSARWRFSAGGGVIEVRVSRRGDDNKLRRQL